MKHLLAILTVLCVAIGAGLFAAYGPFTAVGPFPSPTADEADVSEVREAAQPARPVANATALSGTEAPENGEDRDSRETTPAVSCNETAAGKEAPAASTHLAPRPPADAAKARRLLGELTAEENRFKQKAAERLMAAEPGASPRTLSAVLEYLWLVSLNKERYERSLAAFARQDAGEEPGRSHSRDDSYPIDVFAYRQLLQNFMSRVRGEQRYYGETKDQDENSAWLTAWERKTVERQLSPFLEPFLTARYGRWEFSGETGDQLARALWPLRADPESVRGALALYDSARDKHKAVETVKRLLEEHPDELIQALQQQQAGLEFAAALPYVESEALSLAVAPYFPELAAHVMNAGRDPLGMTAGGGKAIPEGTLPNGMTVRKLAEDTLPGLVGAFPDNRLYLGTCNREFRLVIQGDAREVFSPLMAGTPLEKALDNAWGLSLLSPDAMAARSSTYLDVVCKTMTVPVFVSNEGGMTLAAHLTGLGLAVSGRELRMRGSAVDLGELAMPAFRHGDDLPPPSRPDPEGVAVRMSNPLHALHFFTMVEQASAEQADRILGPIIRMVWYLPGEGWISIGRPDTEGASAWNGKAAPAPGHSGHIPLAFPDAYLDLLSGREILTQEAAMIMAAASERGRKDDGRQPPDTADTEKTTLRVRALTALLDTNKVAGLSARSMYYRLLFNALRHDAAEAEAFLRDLEPILQKKNLPLAERLRMISMFFPEDTDSF